MRVLVCTVSTLLLSGCSWMGTGYNSASSQGGRYAQNSYGAQYSQNAQAAAYGAKRLSPCQISAPTQAIPQGCAPEQVTLALAPQRGYTQGQGAQYTSGGYGSAVGNAATVYANNAEPRLKKPKLRGSMGLEIDRSLSGTLFSPQTSLSSAGGYNRSLYTEGVTTGSVSSGQVVTTRYTSAPERIISPDISIDDAYATPLKVTGGLEYILGKHATVFANGGYVYADGDQAGGAQVVDRILRTTTTTNYVTDPANGTVGAFLDRTVNTAFRPNETVATFNYDFNDYKRVDLEVGGRYYFNPILQNSLDRAVTPFVSASGGASHIGETTVTESQTQRYLRRAFEDDLNDFYDVSTGTPTQIYDAQWVPYGALKAGVEWQMSPKTALAFEAGVKYQGARDFSDGSKGDDNISIPFGIRGSYNF